MHDTEEQTDTFIPKVFERFSIHVLLMKDIIADLIEQVKIKGSRDDVMRFVELIASEEREGWKQSMKAIGQGVKDAKMLQHDKRGSLMKALRVMKKGPEKERKASTQMIRKEG